MNDDIVTQLRTMVQYTNAVAGIVCARGADEIERLRKELTTEQTLVMLGQADMNELLKIAKAFADNGMCRMYDEFGTCIHIDGICDWHDAEHMWESFCMSRGI